MARPINGSIVFNGSNTKTDSLTVFVVGNEPTFLFFYPKNLVRRAHFAKCDSHYNCSTSSRVWLLF